MLRIYFRRLKILSLNALWQRCFAAQERAFTRRPSCQSGSNDATEEGGIKRLFPTAGARALSTAQQLQ
jgi:hypothetical protein